MTDKEPFDLEKEAVEIASKWSSFSGRGLDRDVANFGRQCYERGAENMQERAANISEKWSSEVMNGIRTKSKELMPKDSLEERIKSLPLIPPETEGK